VAFRLRFIKDDTKFPFMGFRSVSFPLSALLSVLTVLAFFSFGVNFGIDFKGGTLVELQAKGSVANISSVRERSNALGFGSIEVAEFGSPRELLLRVELQTAPTTAEQERAQQNVVTKLRETFGNDYEFRRVEVVGPRVSGELVQNGTIGVIFGIIGVLIYLWFRFEWQFAVGAVIATLHDIVLTIGFFVVMQLTFDMTSIAVILTILGYSLNDTVVVYDRIREMLRKYKKLAPDRCHRHRDQLDPVAHSDHGDHHLPCHAGHGDLRRRGAALVLAGHAVRHRHRHVFLDLHRSPDPDLSGPQDRWRGRQGRCCAGAPMQGCDAHAPRLDVMAWPGQRYDGFVPGRHLIDAYGAGGFRFGEMSHKGSILMLPSGVKAWGVIDKQPWSGNQFADVFAEAANIELLLIGTGVDLRPLPEALRWRFKELNVSLELMTTAPAARTYNILVAEGRKIAAALISVD
jgi:preprotein translocase subunit SecF